MAHNKHNNDHFNLLFWLYIGALVGILIVLIYAKIAFKY